MLALRSFGKAKHRPASLGDRDGLGLDHINTTATAIMTSICQRCSLRLHRSIVQSEIHHLSKRAFTYTANGQRGNLPTFHESSNAELNDLLSTFREKHLIPAYLHKHERKLIFGHKYKQQLEDNPQITRIGDEEIQLQWHDRNRDIPNRGKLLTRTLNLIIQGQSEDWENLPQLLKGLKEGIKKPLTDAQLEKIIRQALQNDKLGIVIQCLQQSHRTGLSLKNEAVLRSMLVGLRELASAKEWQKGATARALRDANVIAQLLESEEHGTGHRLASNDPRTRPEVLGLFLELAAVYAKEHENNKDTSGLVRAYARRLISQLEQRGTQPQNLQLVVRSRQWPMLTSIPIWHGLSVAQKILGNDLANNGVVNEAIANYEIPLSRLAAELEARQPDAISYYDKEALDAWNSCKDT